MLTTQSQPLGLKSRQQEPAVEVTRSPRRRSVRFFRSKQRRDWGAVRTHFDLWDPNDVMTATHLVVTTLTYVPNAAATHYTDTCELGWSQACYHYSSARSNNPHWSTLDCPQAAATNNYRNDAAATATWNLEHKGSEWTDTANYKVACDRGEFPPTYLLAETDGAFTEAGKS
ncbi:hypothetical protein FVEG_17248 [Fusarium verticillioides 7600]|uniref:Uncharacterized protein n=1 Tax=Gibberella moniliformis (strain M3125 / FGSC 7600) TaxID=334819 RepID=W7MSP7_GIBM7|nr:hypothetical protein FVEG_17248 [Fusarium verticillioides 7600]EWG54126.1 hypothetical protein FVEG_17248 [Fusarium verticillioides 7600]